MSEFLDELEESEKVDEEVSPEEEETGGLFQDSILSPFMEDGVPLIIFESSGVMYLGGLLEATDKGCVISQPMIFMEQAVPSSIEGQPASLKVGFVKVIQALKMQEVMWFRHNSLIPLKTTSDADVKLVGLYMETVKTVLASDSMVERPSDREISIINAK